MIFKNSGLNTAQFDDMKAALILSFRNSVRLIPSIMVVTSMLLSYITYNKSARAIISSGKLVPYGGPFEYFRCV